MDKLGRLYGSENYTAIVVIGAGDLSNDTMINSDSA